MSIPVTIDDCYRFNIPTNERDRWWWDDEGYLCEAIIGSPEAAKQFRNRNTGPQPKLIPMTQTNKEYIADPDNRQATAAWVNDLVSLCHGLARESGWWTQQPGEFIPTHEINTKLLLVHTEISEATEGLRKDLADDKLKHRPMFEVELSDAVIRIFDLAGACGLDLGGALAEKLHFNASRVDHTPEHRASENGKKF